MKKSTQTSIRKMLTLTAIMICCFSLTSKAGLTLFNSCSIDTLTAKFILDFPDPNVIYVWDFGDGQQDTTGGGIPDVQNKYSSPGVYSVCVVAYDTLFFFLEQNCMTYFAKPDSLKPCCENTNIIEYVLVGDKKARFFGRNNDNSKPLFFGWSFGDGSFDVGSMPLHLYTDTGTYNVCLKIKDMAQCSATICQPIVIYQYPANCDGFANFDHVIDTRTGDVQLFDKSLLFAGTANTTNFTDYFWMFRDSSLNIMSSAEERDPIVYYPPVGKFDIYHLVIDTISMCAYENNKIIMIDSLPPRNCFADFYFEPDFTDSTGLIINFNNMSYANSKITDWYWEFGDGMSSNSQYNMHKYLKPGGYNVCLSITDSLGCTDRGCKFIEIGNVGCFSAFNFKVDSASQMTLSFLNNSSLKVSDYYWDFGDGTSSAEQFPVHSYPNPGYYQVCLSVYDNVNGCSNYSCQFINIGGSNAACYSHFSFWSDDTIPNMVYLQFDGASSPTSNGFWTLGDGNFAYTEYVSYQYAKPGVYQVCATVFDSISKCQDQYCTFIHVGSTGTDPNACFTFADFSFIKDTVNAVAFYNLSNQFTQSYWEFGDGNSSNSSDAYHQYQYPGYYNVCLTVYDDSSSSGCQRRFCNTVSAGDDATACYLKADFSFFPDTNGTSVTFKNSSMGDYTNSYWSLGDGFFVDSTEGRYVYSKPGFYEVCLTVYNNVNGCQHTTCRFVQAGNGNPNSGCFSLAEFEFYPLGNGVIKMNNTAQGAITNVHWDFGDGVFSGQWSPNHKYLKPGYYNICLTVFDSISKCQKTRCEYIKIEADTGGCFIVANYSVYSDFSNGTNSVHFQNLSYGSVTNVFWDFGDGNYSRNFNPTHVYAKTGYYKVCLTVFDSITGCHRTFCDAGEVIDPNGTVNYCHAFFTAFPDAANNFTGHFQNDSKGAITNVFWDFSDGTYSKQWNPVHTFPGPGYYTVCLNVFDTISGCQSRHCESGEILHPDSTYNNVCDASFSYYPDPNKNAIHFVNESRGAFTKVHWDFGDGTGQRTWDAIHKYPGPGYYEACLTVYNDTTGCISTYCEWVDLIDTAVYDQCVAAFEFFVDPTNYTVNFSDISKGNITHYFWEFPDGRTFTSPNVTRQYPGPGYYKVCHAIFDSTTGCLDRVCEVIAIFDSSSTGCLAQFSYYPDNQSNIIDFINESEGNFTHLYWQFGDGRVSNVFAPHHKFDKPGYYDVCLSVFNKLDSCISTYCDVVQINDSTTTDCQAYFEYATDSATRSIYFTDKSFGNVINWYWSMGDNGVAITSKNPNYTFAKAGIYEICMTIETSEGCQRSFCKVVQIGDGGNDCFAEYNYYADSLTATAYFDNQSLGQDLSYTWEFGDDTLGFVSNQKEPAHTYPGTGVYPTCLTVANDSGCVKTICHYVNIGNDLADKCEFSCVWPGDANNDLEANHYDLIAICLNYAETGPARDSVSTRWIGHYAQDWSTYQISGVNNKHGDCNGDGAILLDDILAIKDNFAYSHPRQYNKSSSASNPDLYFEITDADIAPGSTVEVSIMAGKDTISMYGIGFEVKIDKNASLISSMVPSYANSWLGTESVDMLTFSEEDNTTNELLVSVSKNDQVDASGMGEITTVTFTIDSSAIVGDEVIICLSSEYGMDSNGDTITVNSNVCDTLTVTGIGNIPVEAKIKLYPNPTTGIATLELPREISGKYELAIINTLGQNVYSIEPSSERRIQFDMSNFNSGLYYIEIISEKAVYQKPLYLTK